MLWFLGQIVGLGLGILWARRCSRYYFARRLRRNGLPLPVIEEMARRYHSPGLIRDLIRSTRAECTS